MSRTRVAIICQHLTMGGAEELVLGMATHLPRDRYDVHVLCLTREGLIARELREAGVSVELISGEPGPRDPVAFGRLYRAIRRFSPQVVHTFLLNACLYGRLAAILARVPVVVAAEQNVYEQKARRHALLERALGAGTYRVIACCQTVAGYYQRQVRLPAEKVEVIYNAVRFDQLLPLVPRADALAVLGVEANGPVLGTMGRLSEQKGHDVLLEAIPQLLTRWPGLTLLVAGEGERRAELGGLAHRLGIPDRVRFLGVRRDRASFYGALDLFILPSRWEGLSLALAEAVGAGVPTVATRVGGNHEVIEDGRTGLLVPPDDLVALGGAITSLLESPERRASLAAAGANEIQARFGIGEHVRQLDALYQQALSRRDASAAEALLLQR